jgi:hypothetical protein
LPVDSQFELVFLSMGLISELNYLLVLVMPVRIPTYLAILYQTYALPYGLSK